MSKWICMSVFLGARVLTVGERSYKHRKWEDTTIGGINYCWSYECGLLNCEICIYACLCVYGFDTSIYDIYTIYMYVSPCSFTETKIPQYQWAHLTSRSCFLFSFLTARTSIPQRNDCFQGWGRKRARWVWDIFFLKLKWNSHSIKCTILKCTLLWYLVHPQACVTTTSIQWEPGTSYASM